MAGVCVLLVTALTTGPLFTTAQEVFPGEEGAGHRLVRSLEIGGDSSWLSRGLQRSSESDGDEERNTNFWVARGKKAIDSPISSSSFYWGPNQSLLGEPFRRGTPILSLSSPGVPMLTTSGWESNPSLWGKRNTGGPFWASRGKRFEVDPFWVSRGRREVIEVPGDVLIPEEPLLQEQESEEQTWDGETKRNGGPFWISRGKKNQHIGSTASKLASLWAIRGRKSGQEDGFWGSRGKKETEARGPFWAARGKRNGGTVPGAGQGQGTGPGTVPGAGPYWISRGKKHDPGTGSSGPYWIARGKKGDVDGIFWAARGKKDQGEMGVEAIQDGTGRSFWVARGKKNTTGTEGKTKGDDGQHEDEAHKGSDHYIKGFTALSGQ